MRITRLLLVCCLATFSATACASGLPPIKPVAQVDLPRFMGKWYLIATIPTSYGKDAYNAVETYTLKPDGDIHTTFRFNNGAFDGTVKDIHSTGYVSSGTGNAVWGVALFWPFKLQYIVAWLQPDYSQMIVARDKRDYVWVFARTPQVSQADYDALVAEVGKLGYDTSKVREVPQKWPSTTR
ncbi:MAG: lipocalin family protein [Rhodanobacteraceae bacterium]